MGIVEGLCRVIMLYCNLELSEVMSNPFGAE